MSREFWKRAQFKEGREIVPFGVEGGEYISDHHCCS